MAYRMSGAKVCLQALSHACTTRCLAVLGSSSGATGWPDGDKPAWMSGSAGAVLPSAVKLGKGRGLTSPPLNPCRGHCSSQVCRQESRRLMLPSTSRWIFSCGKPPHGELCGQETV